MTNIDKITGMGMVFPIELEDGSVKLKSGVELIKSCLYNILAFEYGHRYFQRDFGVELKSLLSEPNDVYIESLLDYRLNNQLIRWDNRIEVSDLTFRRDRLGKLEARLIIGLTGIASDENNNLNVDVNLNILR